MSPSSFRTAYVGSSCSATHLSWLVVLIWKTTVCGQSLSSLPRELHVIIGFLSPIRRYGVHKIHVQTKVTDVQPSCVRSSQIISTIIYWRVHLWISETRIYKISQSLPESEEVFFFSLLYISIAFKRYIHNIRCRFYRRCVTLTVASYLTLVHIFFVHLDPRL